MEEIQLGLPFLHQIHQNRFVTAAPVGKNFNDQRLVVFNQLTPTIQIALALVLKPESLFGSFLEQLDLADFDQIILQPQSFHLTYASPSQKRIRYSAPIRGLFFSSIDALKLNSFVTS